MAKRKAKKRKAEPLTPILQAELVAALRKEWSYIQFDMAALIYEEEQRDVNAEDMRECTPDYLDGPAGTKFRDLSNKDQDKVLLAAFPDPTPWIPYEGRK